MVVPCNWVLWGAFEAARRECREHVRGTLSGNDLRDTSLAFSGCGPSTPECGRERLFCLWPKKLLDGFRVLGSRGLTSRRIPNRSRTL